MELTLVMRFRIAAAMGVGAVVLGWLGWPLVRPVQALGAVTLFGGDISFLDAIICIGLEYVVGLLACVVSYPYGRQIAPLAVPAGLGVWAVRSGDMSSLLRTNYTFAQRQEVFGRARGYIHLENRILGMLKTSHRDVPL